MTQTDELFSFVAMAWRVLTARQITLKTNQKRFPKVNTPRNDEILSLPIED